jgi:NTE family protein
VCANAGTFSGPPALAAIPAPAIGSPNVDWPAPPGTRGSAGEREIVVRRTVTPRQVLGVASLGAALAFVDATIVNVAFPDIRADFEGSTLAGISWVLNAYNIVFAAFIVAAGRIADLLGRKRLFEWGIVVFTLASVLCALAPSVEFLVGARVLQAIGAAITVPASLALVLQSFPEGERAHGVALWSAAAALAAGLGPSLGGVLVEAGGWRLAFIVNLPIGVLALMASKRTLVESRAPGRRSIPDLFGALLLAGATATLTLGIVKGEEWGWGSPGVLLSFGAALAIGAAFVERCTWHPSPMVDLALLRIRSLTVSNVITVLAAAGFYAYVLCNVLFLTTVWGYSVLEAGLAITPGPFVAAAVARPASRLAERIGPGPTAAAGALVWAAGVAYLAAVVGAQPDFLGQWLPGMAILGIGAGITFPVVGSAAVAEVTGGRFATATGINSVSRQLGAVLGVALLVAIVGTPAPAEISEAFDRGWIFAAACFAATAAGALAIGRVAAPESESGAPERERRAPLPAPVAAEPRGASVRPSRPAEPRPRSSPADFLRSVPMFAGLPQETIERIAAQAVTTRLHAGEWLFRQGDLADGVHVVVSGRLDVVREEQGDPELLRVIGPKSVVGELALLADSERSASIRARRDSELLKLTRDRFDALVAGDRHFTGELVRLMGVQLQRSRALEPPGPSAASVIALVPAHDGLPMEEIGSALMQELGTGGSIVRLAGPADTPLDPAAEAALLERYEQEEDVVVLAAEREGDWRDFCLRHADRIALVAGDRPVPAELDRKPLAGCDLLFLNTGAGGVGPWIDVLEPRTSQVLEQGVGLAPSVAAAARRLAGRSVGLVLSGGGARAFAHIGAIEELVAAGYVIDRVGGCSMGAFVGAMFAIGMDPDEIDARCYEEWVRRNPLSDYGLPRHALIRGQRVKAMLARNLPGMIEDLPRDFFCVSGDLPTAELVVHRRGELWKAVGASMSLPGLVAPALLGDRMLVDGGVLNNLPVDVMAATGEGPVIAVDVTNRFERPAPTTNGRRRTGRFRRNRDRGDDEDRLPGLSEALTRALLLGSVDTAEAARVHASLVITPDSDGVGMLEWHQLDRMREAGRRAAAEALERAPEVLAEAGA